MPSLNTFHSRSNAIALMICLLLLATAAYFQYVEDLQPCPLCIVQRWILVLLAINYFIGLWLKQRRWQLTQSSLTLIFSLLGILVAARQVWLQHLPADRVPECGPDLNFMLQHFPLRQTISFLVTGSGECARVTWQLLGLSMAEWMLGFFILFAVLSVVEIGSLIPSPLEGEG